MTSSSPAPPVAARLSRLAREHLSRSDGDASLRARLEIDPALALDPEDALFSACARLFAFVRESAAPGSDVDVELSRPGRRLHIATACALSVRWIVADDEAVSGDAIPIRPRTRDARSLADSRDAGDLAAAFRRAGFAFHLATAGEGRELWARASRG